MNSLSFFFPYLERVWVCLEKIIWYYSHYYLVILFIKDLRQLFILMNHLDKEIQKVTDNNISLRNFVEDKFPRSLRNFFNFNSHFLFLLS